ncbi:MAG: carbon monoxide dehydrogenase [Rhizobiales bacterium 32-66-8]|nr:MAG: carbon monoxide dehydrogenase [Rhizobiales bacterium 32-66-8]
MYAFDYERPAALEAAVALLRDADAKVLAGGQTLLPTLKQRLAQPSVLVDLARIPALSGVTRTANGVSIGAMTPHAAVATSDLVQEIIPALADLAGLIGDPAVRNRGTLGGSIANNDPTADYPAACLALGATITTTTRSLAAEDFFTGLFETALAEDELVEGADGVRVTVTGVGQGGVFRWEEAEAALTANFAPEALDGLTLATDALMSDLHGSAAYRAQLASVMAKRAVASLV